MKSPIARFLAAASRLAEWAHRQLHGPKFAPGDVVEMESEVSGVRGEALLLENALMPSLRPRTWVMASFWRTTIWKFEVPVNFWVKNKVVKFIK